MRKIRIGAPNHLAARPLIYGLTQGAPQDAVLVYGAPGRLASDLERGDLDVALVPSIEFLRGTGRYAVEGPVLAVSGATGALALVTSVDPAELRRIAVDENSRTPLAVLRIVLDQLYACMPDFCVHKGNPTEWAEEHDGVLLAGDRALHFTRHNSGRLRVLDLGEAWVSLFSVPFVLSLWAYNDPAIGSRLGELLVTSRDTGVGSLPQLTQGLAVTSGFEADFLREFYAKGWSYDMGPAEEAGFRVLEQHALGYQLIQAPRLAHVLTG